MPRFHRKTAPGVRDGRVGHKNNWTRSPSIYRDPQPRLVIDRRRPGAGYQHVLLKRDVEGFVELIPNWDELAVGLDVIVLDCGRRGCDGWYDRGVIGLVAWPRNLRYAVDPDWYRRHREFLARIDVRTEGSGNDLIVHWTPETARAYQLCHVFLHELGHHADRMHTRLREDNAPRGERFAEDYAFALEREVLERYFEEFGLPS